MSGIPGGEDRRTDPNGPAPSEVEALLVATLAERADDVRWDPALADVTSLRPGRAARGDGRGGSLGGVGPRRVPAAVAWLSAAAAVVLVAVGATAMLGDGQDRGLPSGPATSDLPTATGAPTAAVLPPEPSGTVTRVLPQRFAAAVATRPVRGTCAEVPTSTSDAGLATVEAAPDLTWDPDYTDPARPPADRPTSTVYVLPSGGPTEAYVSYGADGTPGATVGTAQPGAPPPVTVTGFPTGGPLVTPDGASDAVAYRLARAIDDRRFAELSLGPGVVVVHVVRGVDEAGARTLVASCTSPSDGVVIQLVDRSEAQLRAVAADASDPDRGIGTVTGAWVDTQRNRVLVGVDRVPTDAERARCAELYGGVVAYSVAPTGVVLEAVS